MKEKQVYQFLDKNKQIVAEKKLLELAEKAQRGAAMPYQHTPVFLFADNSALIFDVLYEKYTAVSEYTIIPRTKDYIKNKLINLRNVLTSELKNK